ncbi:MAG TPA: FxLYD domain-containing protein [Chthonomonadales bacterium]|nr:FxLYD domain-containing protein [Chthonomonadales bacterium]
MAIYMFDSPTISVRGGELAAFATRRARRRRTARMIRLRFAIALCTLVPAPIIWARAHCDPTPLALHEQCTAGGQVKLISASAERNMSFVTITGAVSNSTKRPLRSVDAVVELLDSHGNPIALQDHVIALDPLLTGEVAPFQVVLEDNNRAAGYCLRFRKLLGPPLD